MTPTRHATGHVVLAQVVRSSVVEGEHHGTAVALDAAGDAVAAAGDLARAVFPRSSAKPLQAVAMLRAGLDLDGHLLALGAASHSGERYHLDGVRRILARVGLGVEALRTPPDQPLDPAEAQARRLAGLAPSPVTHNCSGQHAAMLATCQINGWPIRTYCEADHPLQRHISATVAELAGEPPAAIGVDGCGVPVHAITLPALARAYARIATAEDGSPEHLLAQAIRTHPEWLGGTGREITELLRSITGLVAKDGFEGVYAAALPDGRACALKIADGAGRARTVVLGALLRRLAVDEDVLDVLSPPQLLGGGRPVGEVVAVDLPLVGAGPSG